MLDGIVILLALILNPRAERRRRREVETIRENTLQTESSQRDASIDDRRTVNVHVKTDEEKSDMNPVSTKTEDS